MVGHSFKSGLPDIHAGLMLSRRSRTSLMSYVTINERVMKARLNAKQIKATIIVAYRIFSIKRRPKKKPGQNCRFVMNGGSV